MKSLYLMLALVILTGCEIRAKVDSRPSPVNTQNDFVLDRDWLNKNGYATLCGEQGLWWPARHTAQGVECWSADKDYFQASGVPHCPSGHNCEMRLYFYDIQDKKELQ